VLALGCVASDARADPEEITVVAGPRAALASRLTKEMQAAGLVVHVEATEPPSDAPSLFIVVPEAEGAPIEIWAVKDGKRTLVASVASDGPADTRVLRAAEIARALAASGVASTSTSAATATSDAVDEASGAAPPLATATLATSPATPPPAATVAAGAPTADTTSHEPPRPWQWEAWRGNGEDRRALQEPTPPSFDFGLALGLGLQAQGPTMQIEASAHVWPADRFGIGFFASGAALGADMETNEGVVTLRSSILGIELATAPLSRLDTFSLLLSPGLGLDWIHVDATPSGPSALPTGGDGVQLALYAHAEIRVAVAGPLRLTASAMGGGALPPVDITFRDIIYSTFAGFGSASLGAELEP